MNTPEALLARLDAIGQAVAATGHGLAVLGLGSVGLERERLDAFSDLDFFAIVRPGSKADFLANLDWLAAAHPLSYSFQNTPDGYKALFADGIFAEFAVFEPAELSTIPYAPGHIVWQAADVEQDFSQPLKPMPGPDSQPDDWHLGEALTNLYVGLGRARRGELLSAMRFVQSYAVDRVLTLVERSEQRGLFVDAFTPERRIERRLPEFAANLPYFAQGYTRSPESALAILAFLERHFPVSPAIAAAIRELSRDQ